ncbi:MAG: hypothetical protein WAT81_04610 [Candidatus Moraniibacteriota bacterium]
MLKQKVILVLIGSIIFATLIFLIVRLDLFAPQKTEEISLQHEQKIGKQGEVKKSALYASCFNTWKPKVSDPSNAAALRETYCICFDSKIGGNPAVGKGTYDRLVANFSTDINVVTGKNPAPMNDPEVTALGEAYVACLNQIVPEEMRGDRSTVQKNQSTSSTASKIPSDFQIPSGNPSQVRLTVKNKSTLLNLSDVKIDIDGKEIMRGSLVYDSPREITLQLAPGKHWINVSSQNARSDIDTSFEVTQKTSHYAVVAYFWENAESDNFSFSISQ